MLYGSRFREVTCPRSCGHEVVEVRFGCGAATARSTTVGEGTEDGPVGSVCLSVKVPETVI